MQREHVRARFRNLKLSISSTRQSSSSSPYRPWWRQGAHGLFMQNSNLTRRDNRKTFNFFKNDNHMSYDGFTIAPRTFLDHDHEHHSMSNVIRTREINESPRPPLTPTFIISTVLRLSRYRTHHALELERALLFLALGHDAAAQQIASTLVDNFSPDRRSRSVACRLPPCR